MTSRVWALHASSAPTHNILFWVLSFGFWVTRNSKLKTRNLGKNRTYNFSVKGRRFATNLQGCTIYFKVIGFSKCITCSLTVIYKYHFVIMLQKCYKFTLKKTERQEREPVCRHRQVERSSSVWKTVTLPLCYPDEMNIEYRILIKECWILKCTNFDIQHSVFMIRYSKSVKSRNRTYIYGFSNQRNDRLCYLD
jgi:hypothetical protein